LATRNSMFWLKRVHEFDIGGEKGVVVVVGDWLWPVAVTDACSVAGTTNRLLLYRKGTVRDTRQAAVRTSERFSQVRARPWRWKSEKKKKRKWSLLTMQLFTTMCVLCRCVMTRKKTSFFPWCCFLHPLTTYAAPPFYFFVPKRWGKEKKMYKMERERRRKKKRERERERKKKGGTPHSGGAEGSSIH